jgi:hypothetical protein
MGKMLGIILSCYHGVGKSTLSDNDSKYIDHKSSRYLYDESDREWYKKYVNDAIQMCEIGHNHDEVVFLDSFLVVRKYLEELNNPDVPYGVIMWERSAKPWVCQMLKERWENTPDGKEKDKNKGAYIDCLNNFDETYDETIKNTPKEKLFLIPQGKHLSDIINNVVNKIKINNLSRRIKNVG